MASKAELEFKAKYPHAHHKQTSGKIHLNGTSARALYDSNREAASYIRSAITVLDESFNTRDYYPQGDEVKNKAVYEHCGRLDKLREILRELDAIGEHIGNSL